jgi:hypothetical protein
MIGSFSSNVSTLITEKLDLNTSFEILLNSTKIAKMEHYSLRSVLDFCSNSSFDTNLLELMLEFVANLLLKFDKAFEEL